MEIVVIFRIIWNILWPFGIMYGSLWLFGIFFPFWYVWTKKNLATVVQNESKYDFWGQGCQRGYIVSYQNIPIRVDY
jgi:cellobiose-specific phosphotransferase system component IIC